MIRFFPLALLACVYSFCSTSHAQCNSSFGAAVNYGVGTGPRAVARADLNNDNHLDLVVANETTNNVSVLLGNGDGTFQSALPFAAGGGPRSIAIGLLNADLIP